MGEANTAAENPNAQRRTPSVGRSKGGMTDLGTLGGDYAIAYDVNRQRGRRGGSCEHSPRRSDHAFRWTAAGMTDLGTTTGGFSSQANAVDSKGSTVVGWSDVLGGVSARLSLDERRQE